MMFLTEQFLDNTLKLVATSSKSDSFLKLYFQLQKIFSYYDENKDFIPFSCKLKHEALKIFLHHSVISDSSVAFDKVFSNPKFEVLKDLFEESGKAIIDEHTEQYISDLIFKRYSFVESAGTISGIIEFAKKVEEGTDDTIDQIVDGVRDLVSNSFLKQVEIQTNKNDSTNSEACLTTDNAGTIVNDLSTFYKTKLVHVRSGIQELDKILSGGFEGGRLYLFAALSGAGKSLTLLNFCRMALETINQDEPTSSPDKNAVVYITLENFVHESLIRFLSCITGIESYKIKQNGDSNSIIKETIEQIKKMGNTSFFIKYFPAGSATTGDILVYLEELKLRGYKIKLVAVDYLDKLKALNTQYSDQYRLALGEITQDLKSLAVRVGCPVTTATQFNKSGYDAKEQHLGLIGESGKKIDHADVIFLLTMMQNEMQFFVGKNRDGISNVAFTLPLIKNCYKIGINAILKEDAPNPMGPSPAKSRPGTPENSKVFKVDDAIETSSSHKDSLIDVNDLF